MSYPAHLSNHAASNNERRNADIHHLEGFSCQPIINRPIRCLTNSKFSACYVPNVSGLSLCRSSTQPPCLYWWENFETINTCVL